MNTILTGTMVLLAACGTARAQLVLNPGDVFTYEFSTLGFNGMTDLPLAPLGNFSAILNPLTVQPGDIIRLELFESSLSEMPVATTMYENNSLVICQSPFAWQDLQGAIRLTMLSGSATIDVITLRALTPSGGQPPLNAWESTLIPVPEPGALPWLGLGLGLAAGVVWSRGRDHGIPRRGRGRLKPGAWPVLGSR